MEIQEIQILLHQLTNLKGGDEARPWVEIYPSEITLREINETLDPINTSSTESAISKLKQEIDSRIQSQPTPQMSAKIIEAFLRWLVLHVDDVAQINGKSKHDVYDAIDSLNCLI